jgi:CRP-like cAMP-binding protein
VGAGGEICRRFLLLTSNGFGVYTTKVADAARRTEASRIPLTEFSLQPEIARRRQNRSDFLVRLYEIVDASVTTFVNGLEIAEALGIDREEATRIIEYLQEKQFIHIDDHKLGIIRITALGIDHVETGG